MALPSAAGVVVGGAVFASASKYRVLKAVASGCAVAVAVELRRWLSRSILGLKREPYPLEEWVGQYEEDAVEPELAVLDAHHHLWHPAKQDRWPVPKWMVKLLYMLKPRILHGIIIADENNKKWVVNNGERFPPYVPYMGAELCQDIRGNGKGHKIVGTVYLECGWVTPGIPENMKCMEPVKEVDMVTEVHRQFPNLCNAIIAYADLRLGEGVEPALQYYKKNPLVKGIRVSLAWAKEDEPFCGSPNIHEFSSREENFRKGFALLAKYGFSFDSWLYHIQLPELTELAAAFPDTTIICNHMGFPLGIGSYSKEKSFPEWKEHIKALAKHKNVYMKIGGFGMRFPGFGFDERPTPPTSDELVKAWKPYIDVCIEAFGVDRCMMESNFPMDKISCSYTVLFNALKKAVSSYSKEDKQKMFELNARKVYRL